MIVSSSLRSIAVYGSSDFFSPSKSNPPRRPLAPLIGTIRFTPSPLSQAASDQDPAPAKPNGADDISAKTGNVVKDGPSAEPGETGTGHAVDGPIQVDAETVAAAQRIVQAHCAGDAFAPYVAVAEVVSAQLEGHRRPGDHVQRASHSHGEAECRRREAE